MRILLVEDDAELGSGVCASLKREHYAVDWVTDGPSASTAHPTSEAASIPAARKRIMATSWFPDHAVQCAIGRPPCLTM